MTYMTFDLKVFSFLARFVRELQTGTEQTDRKNS